MKAPPRIGRNGRGFTLLEILLAASLFLLVYLALQAILGAAALQQRRGRALASEASRTDRVRALLRSDLAQVLYSGGAWADGVSVEGDGAGRALLTLTTVGGSTREDEAHGDLQRVEYAVTDGSGSASRGMLTRSVRRDLQTLVWEPVPGIELLDGVAAMECDFFDGETWHEQWDSSVSGDLPRAVRIRLRWDEDSAHASARDPFELVVAGGARSPSTPRPDDEP